MKDSEEYRTLVKLCIDTAHALNLKVIAEGVEAVEDLELLKFMKADYIQGYFFVNHYLEDIIEKIKV